MTYNTAPRKPLTKKQRQAFLEAHYFTCYWCRGYILDDKFDDEHVIARELGGSDEMDNRRPIHRLPCHKAKTALDRKLIAKGNRLRRKHGLDPDNRKPKPKMRSRGFQPGKRKLQGRPFPKHSSAP